MIHNTRTLHGTRYAVLALLVATAALAFDLGRNVCPNPAPVQTTLTRAALCPLPSLICWPTPPSKPA